MEYGFDGTSLAVFTGVAPSGIVAFCLVLVWLARTRTADGDARERVLHALFVPLACTWAGFIASATHLGTPANALYAFTNVGHSPLSNEVSAAVAFLFVAGVYWLATFQSQRPRAADAAGSVICIAAGLAALTFMSFAYSVETVPTWDTWMPSVALVLSAFCGGPALALIVLEIAHVGSLADRTLFLRVSLVALALSCAVLVFYVMALGAIGNNVANPGAAIGAYPVAIAAYAFLSIVGLAIQRAASHVNTHNARRLLLACFGGALVLVALVLIRIPFYAAYLSVGF